MPSGFAVTRQWISVQRDGIIILDWGDGRGVDLLRGEFVSYDPKKFSHAVQDDELETLKRMGMVNDYDRQTVFLSSMPENPAHKTLET